MLLPPKLKSGDKVAIVAPARWPDEVRLNGLVDALKRNGFESVIDKQVYEKSGQLAGSDDMRAGAFNRALRDPDIRGIFFPRGGTGSYRVLDKIDYDAARQNPKIIMGYSDADILLAAIRQRSGLVTFRGPMGVNFSDPKADPRTEAECFELLTGKRDSWSWTNTMALKEGVAEGELCGGNLAVLNANIGTMFDVDTRGKIVIVEECDELLYRLDRFLYQAAAAGKFTQAKAVLFATAENMLDGEQHDGTGTPFGKSIADMLRDWVPNTIPLAMNLPLGHAPYLSTHPLGVPVRIEITKGRVDMKLLSPAVS